MYSIKLAFLKINKINSKKRNIQINMKKPNSYIKSLPNFLKDKQFIELITSKVWIQKNGRYDLLANNLIDKNFNTEDKDYILSISEYQNSFTDFKINDNSAKIKLGDSREEELICIENRTINLRIKYEINRIKIFQKNEFSTINTQSDFKIILISYSKFNISFVSTMLILFSLFVKKL
ncbi:hypothetical protein [Guillardia theta]|uniref:Uncharacterized protein n=1 Tax=Guillardia theta TaxID=55529 RepID=Q9AW41_GUITH|nr:hypothetical protein GTHECHR2155 [Guillardia theta]CAC27029.1 hypothetical protein [Guillardia theta]